MNRTRYRRNTALKAVDPKFHPGANPIEMEDRLRTIRPKTKDEVAQLLGMIDSMLAKTQDTGERTALQFWKVQLLQANANDQVQYEFVQRFYNWLLGRGTDEDTAKTLWGRGNAAVYNPQVRAYIEGFSRKRMEYALQLALMSQRVPETLNGYYLYFKYITNGKLQRVSDNKGGTFYDLSQDDFLADFEMFAQEFDKQGEPTYAPIIAPSTQRPKNTPAFGGVDANAADPYPANAAQRAQYALQQNKQTQEVAPFDKPKESAEVKMQEMYVDDTATAQLIEQVQDKTAGDVVQPGGVAVAAVAGEQTEAELIAELAQLTPREFEERLPALEPNSPIRERGDAALAAPETVHTPMVVRPRKDNGQFAKKDESSSVEPTQMVDESLSATLTSEDSSESGDVTIHPRIEALQVQDKLDAPNTPKKLERTASELTKLGERMLAITQAAAHQKENEMWDLAQQEKMQNRAVFKGTLDALGHTNDVEAAKLGEFIRSELNQSPTPQKVRDIRRFAEEVGDALRRGEKPSVKWIKEWY